MRFLPSLRTPRPTRIPAPPQAPAALEGKVLQLPPGYVQALAGALGPSRWRRWPVERAVAEGYERVVWTFAAVEAIANNLTRLPFRVMDGEEEVEDHPLARLLNDGRANPIETGRIFRHRLVAQLLLSKPGAFVEVTTSRAGTPVRLDLLPPGRTRIIPGTGDDLIKWFEVVRADGTRNYLPPEKVRWFRRPHPLDAYAGVTPLEACGLSVELDFFADMYNASFLRNDARPAGVLGVEGDMHPDDMDRLEERFGRGPYEAGKTSVVGGRLSWVDLAAKPRDMAYAELSQATKDKILTAFGVPESVLGNASGRTFDNAAQEELNFWVFTMKPLMSLVAAGFDDDSDDGQVCEFDTDGVEVLQRGKKAKQEEARADVAAGLMTIDEYREIAGLPPFDTPYTRALYVPAGKTPIPTREEDAEALGMASPAPAAQGGEVPPPEEVTPIGGGQDATGGQPAPPAPPALPAPGPGVLPAQQPAPAPAADPWEFAPTGGQIKATPHQPARPRRPGVKITVIRGGKDAHLGPARPRVPARERARLEDTVAAALAASAARLVERSAARVASPKMRKGTRHWTPQFAVDTRVGTKALDVQRAVDPDRWADEAAATLAPLLEQATAWFPTPQDGDRAVDSAVEQARRYAAAQAEHVARVAGLADAEGASIDTITGRIRAQAGEAADWAQTVAADLAARLAEQAAPAGRDVRRRSLPA